jgi:hypothetical protein
LIYLVASQLTRSVTHQAFEEFLQPGFLVWIISSAMWDGWLKHSVLTGVVKTPLVVIVAKCSTLKVSPVVGGIVESASAKSGSREHASIGGGPVISGNRRQRCCHVTCLIRLQHVSIDRRPARSSKGQCRRCLKGAITESRDDGSSCPFLERINCDTACDVALAKVGCGVRRTGCECRHG